jgi:hypothetical protein
MHVLKHVPDFVSAALPCKKLFSDLGVKVLSSFSPNDNLDLFVNYTILSLPHSEASLSAATSRPHIYTNLFKSPGRRSGLVFS